LYLAVSEAIEETEGGSMGGLERSLSSHQPTKAAKELISLDRRLAEAGASAGEPNKKRLIGEREPRKIELTLRTRMIEEKIPLPIISKTYSPYPFLNRVTF